MLLWRIIMPSKSFFSSCTLNQALFVQLHTTTFEWTCPSSAVFEQAQCNVSADFSSSCFSLYIWSLVSKKSLLEYFYFCHHFLPSSFPQGCLFYHTQIHSYQEEAWMWRQQRKNGAIKVLHLWKHYLSFWFWLNKSTVHSGLLSSNKNHCSEAATHKMPSCAGDWFLFTAWHSLGSRRH